MRNIFFIILGGGIGSACRHGVFLLSQRVGGHEFPAGTLTVNLLGSLLVGLLWGLLEGVHLSSESRLFIFTGLLGGFTTFSSFSRETAQMFKVGQWKTALCYVGVSNIVGIVLVLVGFSVARQLFFSGKL
ncbi:MAG: fluoride efflux transporter CrcB [Desulfobulbaceae bacterium]|nr:fluoride efflux transporter CrcB [Desulfobulbaceae bacterium]